MQSWSSPAIPDLAALGLGRGRPPRVPDTASGDLVEVSGVDGTVRMYVCGITPYDATHLGHAATYLLFDLIQRLARIKIKDKALSRELDHLIERFNDGTHVRNELNHCMYTVDSSGEISQTQSMRLVQTRGNLRFGETKPLDDARINEMIEAVREMARLNRDIWDFLPRLEAHLR